MYKVCIADDEIYVQKSIIQRIANSGMEIEVVGTAINGIEAISLYEKEKPDIFFVDINMPLINGLDFIEKVKSIDSDVSVQFVIISGYDDFAYMKRAIRLGVVNYIKKPILQEEFLDTLHEICQKLEIGKKHVQKKLEIEFWHNFLENRKEGAISGTFLLIRKKDILKIIESAFDSDTDWKIIAFEKEILNLVLLFREKKQLHEYELRKSCEILGICDAEQIIYYTGEIGDAETFITKFENMLNLRFYCEDLYFTKLRETEIEKFSFDYDAYDAAVENTREEKYKECIEKIFQTIFSDQKYAYLIKHVYQSFIFVLANKYIKYDIPIPEHIRKGIFNFALSYYSTQKDLIDSLIDYSRELNQKILLMYSGCDLVDKVARFIEQHYVEEINLTELAEKFFVVPTYLSKRFKEKKNCTVMHYLEDIRLKKARKLLENSDISIFEVAQMTGYNDQNYFARRFREIYGISPRDYRKTNGK